MMSRKSSLTREEKFRNPFLFLLTKAMEVIKETANKRKITKSSYVILVERLESTLNELLEIVDPEKKQIISKGQLGLMCTHLQIFKQISFNESLELEINQEEFDLYGALKKRRELEIRFFDNLFELVKGENEEAESQAVFNIFRILFDPLAFNPSELELCLLEVQQFPKAKIRRLVKDFKSIYENRLSYVSTGFFKPKKFEEYKKAEESAGQPKVSRSSALLASQQLEKFIEAIGEAEGSSKHSLSSSVF